MPSSVLKLEATADNGWYLPHRMSIVYLPIGPACCLSWLIRTEIAEVGALTAQIESSERIIYYGIAE
jgi:hypothetical protein